MISPKKLLKRLLLRCVGSLFLVSLATTTGFGAGVTIRFTGDSSGDSGTFTKALIEDWAQKTGNKVEIISRPNDATATLSQYQQYWAAKSPDVDVYQVDVIWQGICAAHAVDMKKYVKADEVSQNFPRII
jgi:trehalose/maltose transport system substrate-binding protein